MCGLIGAFFTSTDEDIWETLSQISLVKFRGPDAEGFWSSDKLNGGLGHVRLAVLDVSDAGRQPFTSSNGKLVLSFNGEIYNHNEIRQLLENLGHQIDWKSTSDSETIVECIQVLGLSNTLPLLDGMFAFALFDQEEQSVSIARDRTGQKPLYVLDSDCKLVFGSDPRTIYPSSKRKFDVRSIRDILKFGYIRGEKSVYTDIRKVEPGCVETYLVRRDKIKNVQKAKYYKAELGHLEELSKEEEQARFLEKLEKSVKMCMISDVPIGSFLSGGIDSTLITALMQKNSMQKVKTFTIGFEEQSFDESGYSQKVAEFLSTDHVCHKLSKEQIETYLSDGRRAYAEPFCDPSLLPTLMVAELASKNVTVALSGDGADELLGGYQRYFVGNKLHKFSKSTGSLGRALTSVGIKAIIKSINGLQSSNFTSKDLNPLSSKLKKASAFIGSHAGGDLYDVVMSQYLEPNEILNDEFRFETESKVENSVISDFRRYMMTEDFEKYLVDDILVKVDRASMFYSLETRAPFLNNEFVEYSRKLDTSYLFGNGKGKLIARESLATMVPEQLFERPKMGFGIPLGNWIRTILKEHILEALSDDNLRKVGILDTSVVSRLVNEHLSYKANHEFILWNIYQLQTWALTYHHEN